MYYGFSEFIKHCIFFAYTKLLWPKARLIRLPIYARTKKNIQYETGLTTGYACRLAASKDSKIIIGKNVTMGDYVQIQSAHEVTIGNNVLIASKVYIGDAEHGSYTGTDQTAPSVPPNERAIYAGSVKIHDNVWIGNGVTIVGNLEIGYGTIIGANSVVTKSLEAECIYAGVPARKIKKWNPDISKWELQ